MPPQPSAREIARAEVCDRIFAAAAVRLVLLHAPAGFGKTTTMRQVRDRFAAAGVPTAWLTLDRADNDPARFLSALSLALSPVVPGLEPDAGAGPDELALRLLDRVAAHPAPFVLFLDDFEALKDAGSVGIVAELIEQLPRGAQLVAGTRRMPELGVGRLRTRGRLLEVDPAQLRFSEAEVGDLLRQRPGPMLSPQDVRRLHRSTEGWAAALGLATLSLEHRDDPAGFIATFSGSDRAVVDYLLEDVLAHQPEDVREFLLQTCVLSELHAPLCDAIRGASDSAQMLRRLQTLHLFLLPLAGQPDEYRYHGMFAEFLRGELARQQPQRVPALHHAAARWFAQNQRPVPAIEHALAAGENALALQLLDEQAWALLDEGRVRLLARWLDPLLAAGALAGHPMLRIVHAWAVLFARGPRAAEHLLDRLADDENAGAASTRHRAVLRVLILSLTDRIEEAVARGLHAQSEVPASFPFAGPLLRVTMANLALITGRLDDARRYADEARSSPAGGAGGAFNLTLSEATEASIDLAQGRLRKAIAGLRVAIRTRAHDPRRPTNGNALVGIPLAHALYEAGELEQSERLLGVYLPLIRGVGIPDDLITGHLVIARILAARRDEERAEQMLAELEHIGHANGLPRAVATARLERVRRLVVDGRLSQARQELDRCEDAAFWSRIGSLSPRANEVETWEVALARVLIAESRFAEAATVLREQLAQAERLSRSRRALSLRLLLGVALDGQGSRSKGAATVADAVGQAAGEGYVRVIVDEGPALTRLLREIRDLGGFPETGDVRRFVDRLLAEDSIARTQGPARDDRSGTVETLTRKELKVLRLAAEGHRNEELAERLFIAETTIRTHLRNINVKLDTRSRVEAIAAARRLGLLD
ncbi:MAG TPA: LuxR C-terminal-related transcriptional regulator [Burkholderiaceae bacterium]|nr:LuxR C-terminal-related transcriptional regulator [Burkholderiaceae bacterium]